MEDVLAVHLPSRFACGTCDPDAQIVSDMVFVGLESVLDDHGELIGLRTVARYPGCGHRMPHVWIQEEDVAGVMEDPSLGRVLRAVMLLDDEDEDGGG